MTRYDATMDEYRKMGARLDVRPVERAKAPRDRAGRLAFWEAEARKDLEARDLWASADSLASLSKAGGGERALWSAVCLLAQCRLAETLALALKWEAEDGSEATAMGFWLRMDTVRMPGRRWDAMYEALPSALPDPLPEASALCLLASPSEVARALGGEQEALEGVFRRLISRRRASWTPRGGRGRSPWPRCARP